MKVANPKKDLLAASVVLLSVVAELVLREMYYRVASEAYRLLGVFCLWLLMMLIVWGGARHRRWQQIGGRLALVVACATWLLIVGDAAISYVASSDAARGSVRWVGGVALLIGCTWSLRLDAERWPQVRRALAVAAFLFVASQPVVAAWRAPTLVWPPSNGAATGAGSDRPVTVFLLLDELNASAAGPIVDALHKSGRPVTMKTLVPVDDATAKVVPAMFARERFPDAKPCGLHTICSGAAVLDFSKVVAGRPDVDVVGFYGPYCDMRGLRSCAHLAPSSPVLDGRRWWCAALRRSAWLSNLAGHEADARCGQLVGETWSRMVSEVDDAIWKAPVWRDGGFLFAHVPLPHPPGEGAGSIGDHYRANLARAAALVARMSGEAARQPNRRFTIVVFSDHPLRSSVWCASTQYRHNGCPFAPELIDDKVPLIVAGDLPPAFDAIESNMDIFRLTPP